MSRDHPISSDKPTVEGSHSIGALGEHPPHGDLHDEHPTMTSQRTRASRRLKVPQPTRRPCRPKPFWTSLIKSEL